MKKRVIGHLKSQEKFFLNTISCFTDADSGFRPDKKMYTIAQHIGHAAETIEWFVEGVFVRNEFDMNFENYSERVKKYTSFDECVNYFKEATAKGIEIIDKVSDSELLAPITAQIMTGDPKMDVVWAITDHTAHHRGVLAVYARLLGKVPQMPYGEM